MTSSITIYPPNKLYLWSVPISDFDICSNSFSLYLNVYLIVAISISLYLILECILSIAFLRSKQSYIDCFIELVNESICAWFDLTSSSLLAMVRTKASFSRFIFSISSNTEAGSDVFVYLLRATSFAYSFCKLLYV